LRHAPKLWLFAQYLVSDLEAATRIFRRNIIRVTSLLLANELFDSG